MNLGKYRRKSDKSGKKSKNLHAVSQFCTEIRRAHALHFGTKLRYWLEPKKRYILKGFLSNLRPNIVKVFVFICLLVPNHKNNNNNVFDTFVV